MPASRVLSLRAVNRALLARQLLLEPDTGRDALAAVEHLVGMQAQAPFPPYYGLWSRLDGFRPDDLATLISTRSVVRIALMRGTIHLVSARDCMPLRAIVQPVLDRAFRTNQYKRLTGVDLAELAVRGRELVDAEPMTFSELGRALAQRWPGNPPADLAQGVRALVPLVQVPPRAVWGQAGVPRHTSAEAWLGLLPVPDPAVPGGAAVLDHAALLRRYPAAFGPATVRDIQAWSGLTGLRAAVEELRAMLVTFRDEAGAELFDLQDAPRPPGDAPAPVRLVAEFDNLVLSHADRTRIFAGVDMARMYSINGIVPGSVLVDGFVAGLWRIATARKAATVTIELWEEVTDRRAITSEAERLLAFAAPGATHDIRFGSLSAGQPG
jgi:hypothetical protein